jgi:quercetin dioxygenase-like cupin family protein
VTCVLAGPAAQGATAAGAPAAPAVKVVRLDPGGAAYFRLLGGPPETASMRAGLVTLAPGAAIGKHNTETNEEMLVPLEGEGELRVTGRPTIRIAPGLVTYAPAHTEHDVINTGSRPLRYIFIVAKAE